jgi:hypothetical protein
MPGAHGAGCGCALEDDLTMASQNLLPWIDVDNVVGLNEEVPDTAKRIFRPYDDRLDDNQAVESTDGDPELIIKIPFTAPVKVMSLSCIGGADGTQPTKVVLFINREDLDFQSVGDVAPTQEVDLVEDMHGAIQYPLRSAKFITVTHLCLHFPSSVAEERTRIHWMALYGQGSEWKRQAVTCVYEAVANPKEKQVKDEQGGAFQNAM